MDALEFHVYLNPPPSETRAMALARFELVLTLLRLAQKGFEHVRVHSTGGTLRGRRSAPLGV